MSPLLLSEVPATVLTPRWTPLYHHAAGLAYSYSAARFNVLPAGRRTSKSERAKRKVIMRALTTVTTWADPRYFVGAPTRDQAKRIYWRDLKSMIPRRLVYEISESELRIGLVNGAEIWVLGMDRAERAEGMPWDGGVLDEFANMKPDVWGEHIWPALMDRSGWCDFIGVPEGRNHYWRLYAQAVEEFDKKGLASEWRPHTWRSEEVLPLYGKAAEIETAKMNMDAQTYEQEMGASFLSFQGRAYHTFRSQELCSPLAYDPTLALHLCFDFNVKPGVAAVLQEMQLPTGHDGTGAIGEVWIERDSNTRRICRALALEWGKHSGTVYCYGDASGGSTHTSQTEGNDWELIKKELRPVFGDRLHFRVPAGNPSVRARINAFNSRIESMAGECHFMVDRHRCPHLVEDLEGVQVADDGGIKKDKDPRLTHISDAVGYYMAYRFPVRESNAGSVNLGLSG